MIETWIAKSLNNRTFELKCPKMCICIGTKLDSPLFEGSGRIWISERGQMKYSMLVRLENPAIVFEWMPHMRVMGQPPKKQPVCISDYFQVQAYDLNGHSWITNWLIPCCSLPLGDHAEIYGDVEHISSYHQKSPSDVKQSAAFVILQAPRLPFTMTTRTSVFQGERKVRSSWSLNREEIKVDGVSVYFEQVEGDTGLFCTITPSEDRTLPNWASVPLVEALRFILGHPVYPACYWQEWGDREVTYIEGYSGAVAKCDFLPPFIPNQSRDYETVWKIFETYLRYLLGKVHDIAPLSPIGAEYARMMQASAGSLEGFALALTVGVEAVLKVVEKPDGLPDTRGFSETDLHELTRHLNSWKGNVELRKRAGGAVGRLNEISANEKLRRLENKGIVSKEERKAWEDLRTKCAHGGRFEDNEIPNSERSLEKVTGLLHKTVLYEIGYAGEFTNYSREGWPNEEVPWKTDDKDR